MLGIIEPSMLEELLNHVLEKNQAKILEFINAASEFEAEMVIDELMLYLKELLLGGSQLIKPMIIERFFRVLAESKGLLNMGADGDFVLSLTLFKMMESLQVQDIDGMIRTLEKELSGVKITATPETRRSVSPDADNITEPKQEPKIQEEVIEQIIEKPTVPEPVEIKPLDAGAKLFEELIVKMYDRNYELGECFKHAINYTSFNENILTWESAASSEQKTLLKNNWMTIRTFVQELYGYECKIKNNAKELPSSVEVPKVAEKFEEPTSMIEDEVLNQPVLQEEEMKSSCISPGHGGVEAAKEKDEQNILDEPMIAKALELFNPKTVRVKRK